MSRMNRFDWLSRQARRRSQNSPRYDRRLRVEPLEDRLMLSITVNTLVDELDGSIVDGDISLRDAIAAATPGETIDFSVTGTLLLTIVPGAMEAPSPMVTPGAITQKPPIITFEPIFTGFTRWRLSVNM